MDIEALARKVGQELKLRQLMLTTAESCTGGWVAQAVTSASGSSDWFDCGFVTYTNQSKTELLGVAESILSSYGAVSEQAARAMVEGALARSGAQVALAVTGIAGPTGGTAAKPVGTVWLAWTGANRVTKVATHVFTGDRQSIRHQAVRSALKGLIDFLGERVRSAEG